MKVLELFGGIGSPRSALNKLDIEFDVVDYVEIDKFAVNSYNEIYGEEYVTQDIRGWDKDVEVDIIFHGSPCQDFSILGLQGGGEHGSGTRSSLMWETVRIVRKIKPKYVVWENVRNVLSEKHISTFNKYIEYMSELGYTSYYELLNSKNYGVPQNRDRVFVVSILGEHRKYEFPKGKKLNVKLSDIIEGSVEDKYYISESHEKNNKDKTDGQYIEGIYDRLSSTKKNAYLLLEKIGYLPDMFNVYNKAEINDISPTITTISSRSNCSGQVLIKSDSRIRKLTPKECWRLMGFSDEQFKKAEKVNSTSQLYKQAGNSIVVNVLVAIIMVIIENESK